MDPEIRIRRASEADGPILAEIERNSPLGLGDGSLTIDRGDDYFAAARLMADATVLVAEGDGEPAGVFCGARHRARIGGGDRWLVYVHPARILPRYQRVGLGRRSGAAIRDAYASVPVDSQYWYISPENEKSLGFARGAKNRWSVLPEMVTIDTAAAAGPSAGRPTTPTDAAVIVAALNAVYPYDWPKFLRENAMRVFNLA